MDRTRVEYMQTLRIDVLNLPVISGEQSQQSVSQLLVDISPEETVNNLKQIALMMQQRRPNPVFLDQLHRYLNKQKKAIRAHSNHIEAAAPYDQRQTRYNNIFKNAMQAIYKRPTESRKCIYAVVAITTSIYLLLLYDITKEYTDNTTSKNTFIFVFSYTTVLVALINYLLISKCQPCKLGYRYYKRRTNASINHDESIPPRVRLSQFISKHSAILFSRSTPDHTILSIDDATERTPLINS